MGCSLHPPTCNDRSLASLVGDIIKLISVAEHSGKASHCASWCEVCCLSDEWESESGGADRRCFAAAKRRAESGTDRGS